MEEAQDAKLLWTYIGRKFSLGNDTISNPKRLKMDDKDYVIVYTDGACPSNGRKGAKAGIGVWFGANSSLNVSEPLSRQDPATNQVAEIRAAIRAIEMAKTVGVGRLEIRTDSKYLCDSMNKWIVKWLTNGWKNCKGQKLGHRNLFRELMFAMNDMHINWCHVRGHNKDKCATHRIGNNAADQLARKGAKRY